MEEENTKYELFLHMVGGHAFILTTGEGKLIKSAKVKEIEFYEFCEGKDISKHIPKYYGKILINSKEFWEIEKFYRQLKIFFRQFVLECNFSAEFLNTENDENFNENYKLFLSEYNKEHKYSYEKYFQKLRSYLLSVCRNKLKWILFWFIKWHHSFMKNDFIIIEDLTADMSHPAILDLKLWSISKSSKKVPTVTTDIGCRIMGEEVKHFT